MAVVHVAWLDCLTAGLLLRPCVFHKAQFPITNLELMIALPLAFLFPRSPTPLTKPTHGYRLDPFLVLLLIPAAACV
jgi:hypothetical protein